jgi:hypothetical protein
VRRLFTLVKEDMRYESIRESSFALINSYYLVVKEWAQTNSIMQTLKQNGKITEEYPQAE